MKQIDLREGGRRQHRAIALFAVIQCWKRGLDGLAFSRDNLERLIGIERFKKTRVEWLKADFKDFFPYQQTYVNGTSFAGLFVCRKPFVEYLPKGRMYQEDRIANMHPEG